VLIIGSALTICAVVGSATLGLTFIFWSVLVLVSGSFWMTPESIAALGLIVGLVNTLLFTWLVVTARARRNAFLQGLQARSKRLGLLMLWSLISKKGSGMSVFSLRNLLLLCIGTYLIFRIAAPTKPDADET